MEIKVEQNTPEWMALRCGKITASAFDVLIPVPKTGISTFTQGQRTYLIGVAAEILTGKSEDGYESFAMQQGHEREPYARKMLSDVINEPVRTSGFWQVNDYVGMSPDGIGGFDDFTVELKCPQPKAHMLYLLDMDEFLKKYQWQIKGHMWGTGIHRAFYGSFNPDFADSRIFTYGEIELSESDKDLFDNRIGYAIDLLKEWTE